MRKHLSAEAPSLDAVGPGLGLLVEKMMAKDPSDRYQTPHELIAAVDRLESDPSRSDPFAPTIAGDRGSIEFSSIRSKRANIRSLAISVFFSLTILSLIIVFSRSAEEVKRTDYDQVSKHPMAERTAENHRKQQGESYYPSGSNRSAAPASGIGNQERRPRNVESKPKGRSGKTRNIDGRAEKEPTGPGNSVFPIGSASKLHRAASSGAVETVRRLLSKGTDPNQQDAAGNVPLHYAVRQGRVEISRALLDHGANPNIKDRDGNTPLRYAVEQSDELTRYLLNHGARPNTRDASGNYPLHRAVERHNLELTRYLLNFGADPNRQNRAGMSPLQIARGVGDTEMVRVLKERGAQ